MLPRKELSDGRMATLSCLSLVLSTPSEWYQALKRSWLFLSHSGAHRTPSWLCYTVSNVTAMHVSDEWPWDIVDANHQHCLSCEVLIRALPHPAGLNPGRSLRRRHRPLCLRHACSNASPLADLRPSRASTTVSGPMFSASTEPRDSSASRTECRASLESKAACGSDRRLRSLRKLDLRSVSYAQNFPIR